MAFMLGHVSVALLPISISFSSCVKFFPILWSIWNPRVSMYFMSHMVEVFFLFRNTPRETIPWDSLYPEANGPEHSRYVINEFSVRKTLCASNTLPYDNKVDIANTSMAGLPLDGQATDKLPR